MCFFTPFFFAPRQLYLENPGFDICDEFWGNVLMIFDNFWSHFGGPRVTFSYSVLKWAPRANKTPQSGFADRSRTTLGGNFWGHFGSVLAANGSPNRKRREKIQTGLQEGPLTAPRKKSAPDVHRDPRMWLPYSKYHMFRVVGLSSIWQLSAPFGLL